MVDLNHASLKMSNDPDLLLSDIGLRILRRRQELGLTQKDLAQAVGMQAANIGQMEHGERNLTIRTLCKLADALGITLAELTAGPASAAERTEPRR